MTDGLFKTSGLYGYARAAVVMSTQSETVFEWSVKLIGPGCFRVGIASELRQNRHNSIYDYDRNSILYTSQHSGICIGPNKIHSPPAKHKAGDVVHFRFQPQTKKFVFRLVRISKSSPTNLRV